MHLPGFASVAEGAAQAAERGVETARAHFAPIGKRPTLHGIRSKSPNLRFAKIAAMHFLPRGKQRRDSLASIELRACGESSLALDARFFVERLPGVHISQQEIVRGADRPFSGGVGRGGFFREPVGFEFREFAVGNGFQRCAETFPNLLAVASEPGVIPFRCPMTNHALADLKPRFLFPVCTGCFGSFHGATVEEQCRKS